MKNKINNFFLVIMVQQLEKLEMLKSKDITKYYGCGKMSNKLKLINIYFNLF